MNVPSQPVRAPKKRGRPRGSRNQNYKPETVTISVRVTESEAIKLRGLLAKGWLLNSMRGKPVTQGRIIIEALTAHMKQCESEWNKFVNEENQRKGSG